jgi:two-component system chemotaxis response regulator CheB
MPPIKVLIVDDSALVRHTLKVLLESDPEIKVIGTAGDPYVAVHKIQKEKPDVITLDIEMPRMDGLTFLKKIMDQAPMPVVIITSQTLHSTNVGLRALEIGAVDVITKPDLSNQTQIEESKILIIDKVRSAFLSKRKISPTARNKGSVTYHPSAIKQSSVNSPLSHPKVIAVGASTGGTEAIRIFLQSLSLGMPPILIVQHMPEKFTASFAKRLNDICDLSVKEAEDNELLADDTVYIAQGNKHLSVKKNGGRYHLQTYHGELVNRHRPSVNVLFKSVAEVAGRNAIGIIMTGMGDDGAVGLLEMRKNGAFTIAQNENSCVVFGMPQKAISAGAVDEIWPLEDIGKIVLENVNKVKVV